MPSVSNNCAICTHLDCRGGTGCRTLRTLYKRKITILDDIEKFGGLLIASSLDLSNLHLKTLPRDFFIGLSNIIIILDLSGNDFVDLPWWTFQHIQYLDGLNLANNTRLADVYSALAELNDVWCLRLNLANCTALAATASDCIRLDRLLEMKTKWREIDLSGCGLTQLPPKAFEKMPNLYDLDLSNNRLKEFRLKHDPFWRLDLSKNPIRYVDCAVEDLQLDNCGINSLEGLFSPITRQHLGMLGLSHNHLTILKAADFVDFPELSVLGLASNKIRDIEENVFTGVPQLSDVYLNDNLISYIPEGFFRAYSYSSVNLSQNRLAYIHPLAFQDSPHHAGFTLKLADNPNLAFQPTDQDFDSFSDCLNRCLEPLFAAQKLMLAAQKQSRLFGFHEEFMMKLMAPERMERLMAEHGMEAVLESFG
jgi:Leucine-rich repeat (LRR) protein